MLNNSLFDLFSKEDQEKVSPNKSTDWKWTFADYPKKNGLKVFSCFACGGGSTMGYKLAGCDVLGDCEIDKKMNELYVLNHEPKYNYLMDIRDFNNLKTLPAELYNLDILDGSPPCTTFSVSGKREAGWGVKRKFREGQTEQTLDDLSFVFIQTASKLKPKIVIMENVEGLLMGNALSYVDRIYKEFSRAGYNAWHWVLKGEEMGVPQTRHRVFFVAIRKDLETKPFNLDMTFNYEPVLYRDIKAGEGKPLRKDSVLYKWLLKASPKDKRISNTIIRHGEPEKLFNTRICWPNNIVQTIPAAGEILRGEEKTFVSVEDIISSQTFPQDYNFVNRTYSNVRYVCGMSVPPIMIKRIVQRLIESGVFE